MIAVGIVIFLLLLVFVVFPSLNLKAGPRTIDTIENAIYELLRFGYDGAVLTIEFSLSGRALEFRKYVNSSEDYGISFCFSRKRWTRPYFEQVLTYCKQQGASLRD